MGVWATLRSNTFVCLISCARQRSISPGTGWTCHLSVTSGLIFRRRIVRVGSSLEAGNAETRAISGEGEGPKPKVSREKGGSVRRPGSEGSKKGQEVDNLVNHQTHVQLARKICWSLRKKFRSTLVVLYQYSCKQKCRSSTQVEKMDAQLQSLRAKLSAVDKHWNACRATRFSKNLQGHHEMHNQKRLEMVEPYRK